MKHTPSSFIKAYQELHSFNEPILYANMSAQEIENFENQNEQKLIQLFEDISDSFPLMKSLLSYDKYSLDPHDSLITRFSFSDKGILVIHLNAYVYDNETKEYDWSVVQDIKFSFDVSNLPKGGLLFSRESTIDLFYFDEHELALSFWQKNTGKEITQTISIKSVDVTIGEIQSVKPLKKLKI